MVRPSARKTATVARTLCALVAAGLIGLPVGYADAAPQPLADAATGCPGQIAPPPAIDSSEVVAPGRVSPTPVPEPAVPAGGPMMAECGYILPKGAPPLPTDLAYASWVIQDLNTGAVLAAKSPHARERPASLIKLLLAQVVARQLNPATPVIGTQDDANQEGTRVGIGPGGHYNVGLLTHGLLMASGNDAAHALAMQLGGMQVAVDKMNSLARELGAMDTRTASPSGLDAPGMSTSAYDLSIFFKTDLATPLLANAVATKQIPFPGYGDKPGFKVNNDNLLLRTYPGDIGGKNGYTGDALQTYANAAQRNGHRIALVMTRGTNHLAGKWKNARELMDYGFALENLHTTPVGSIGLPLVAAGSATPSANGAVRQAPVTPPTHGGAQVATAPQTSMSTFGNVGLPLTILAAFVVLVGVVLYLRRQRAKKARAARAAKVAAAETVRVQIPADLAAKKPATVGSPAGSGAPTETIPPTAPTPTARQRPVGPPQGGSPSQQSGSHQQVGAAQVGGQPVGGQPGANGQNGQGQGQNGAPVAPGQGGRTQAMPPASAPIPAARPAPRNGAAAPRPVAAPRPSPAQRPPAAAPRPSNPPQQRPGSTPEWPTGPEWPK
jgi:D-alanyl-D-alanine carboxypeptidase (penicillin-binding protein 5/6)